MVNNKMCITIGPNRLMLRIDPKKSEILVKLDNVRNVVMKGRKYNGYIYVNEKELESKENLLQWINLALEFNKKIT